RRSPHEGRDARDREAVAAVELGGHVVPVALAGPGRSGVLMSDDKDKRHPETLAAQGMGRIAKPYLDVAPPVHVSATYERGADGSYPGGRIYSRADNPTYDAAEALIASLEGGAGAMLFSSGQSASATLFQSLAPGDGILAPRNMYWALRKWLLDYHVHWGLRV